MGGRKIPSQISAEQNIISSSGNDSGLDGSSRVFNKRIHSPGSPHCGSLGGEAAFALEITDMWLQDHAVG